MTMLAKQPYLSKKFSVPFRPVVSSNNQSRRRQTCYTVTKNGIVPGIQFLREPYPHVAVGDPALSSADWRRVELDATLANSADDNIIKTCSYIIEMKNSENRRSSYKLVTATGDDDDRVLIKIEARCAAPGQRTFYDLPLNTLALANGWYLAGGKGPQAETPVSLVVLKKGDEVKIHRTVDMHKRPNSSSASASTAPS